MKLKRLPEDFRVDERTHLVPSRGRFAFYRLTKRSLGTPEAIAAIARRWQIAPVRFSFGGLKDKHALTVQHLTIESGPRRGLKQANLELDYLGQLDRPFRSADMRGNGFVITLRELKRSWAAQLGALLVDIQRDGVPNYFDDQRFGSLGDSGEFLARAWINKDYERVCRLALCDPLASDRPVDRRERAIIERGWPDWQAIAVQIAGSRRRLVEHLARRPNDFRGALARIDQLQRSLYLASFQSHLWNLLLSEILRELLPGANLVSCPLATSEAVFYRRVDDPQRSELAALRLPLPSSRLAPSPGRIELALERVLARENLTRRQLKVDYPRDSFFSKADRAALVFPARLAVELADDELYSGYQKATLSFDLPTGSYATMVVKRLTIDCFAA